MTSTASMLYRYTRYHARGEDLEPSLHEAMFRAYADMATNEAYCYEIVDANGTTYDRDAIRAYWHEHNIEQEYDEVLT